MLGYTLEEVHMRFPETRFKGHVYYIVDRKTVLLNKQGFSGDLLEILTTVTLRSTLDPLQCLPI